MPSQNGRKHVLVCDPIHADGLELLESVARVDIIGTAAFAPDTAELVARIGAYDGVIVGDRTGLPASVIQQGERLQIIGRTGAGLENVDVAAARARGIEIITSPDANTLAVAEHTFALILALARHVVRADESVKSGRWDSTGLVGVGLAGKTLGIIGYGRIGRQVGQRAKAFNMRVVVNQNRLTPELALSLGVEQLDLKDLLQQSDFVSLHVPLRSENLGLIGADELGQMKSNAYLINTSRGGIVDEAALWSALDTGKLAGAALDVFEREPEVNPRLVQHPRVLATPHIAASTEEARRDAAVTVCEQVVKLFRQPQSAPGLNLQIVPMDHVVPHERYHGRRVADLTDRLVADGRLVNPPIAATMNGKYVILDGATRLTAFRHLGYPHIVLQVVNPDHEGVALHTWYHAVRGGSVGNLMELVRGIPGLRLAESAIEELSDLAFAEDTVGYMVTADGHTYVLEAEGGATGDRFDVLNRLVDAYGDWGNIDRTLQTDVDTLKDQYPDLAALFVFPPFTIQMVLDLATHGRTMPAGITRFVIPGRVLRLNVPLDKLASNEPLAAKRSWLDRLVRERLAFRHVRYYEEPVVLFDE